jgi:hypothetical protein
MPLEQKNGIHTKQIKNHCRYIERHAKPPSRAWGTMTGGLPAMSLRRGVRLHIFQSDMFIS